MLDKRIIHTKFFLQNALLSLMEIKPIDKITTTELCKAANVARNTFYAYYSIPEDVLSEIEDELFSQVQEILKVSSDEQKLFEIYKHFKENKDVYKVLIINNSNLSNRILELCKKNNIYRWQKLVDDQDGKISELFYLFASSGSNAIVSDWIMNDCVMSIEELQRILDSFSLYGLSAFKK